MHAQRLRVLFLAFCVVLTSPSHAEAPYSELYYTLDLRDAEVADVATLLERIFERPVDRAGLAQGTLTLMAGTQTSKRDVIPVISFALSLRGLTIAETPTGELKLARIPDFHGSCERARASSADVVAALVRGREETQASIQLSESPAIDAVRALTDWSHTMIAVGTATDTPVGVITLASGPRMLADAYQLLFTALEREGNAVLTGPLGALAIVGCPHEPPRKPTRTPIRFPYLLGTLLSEDSSVALVMTGSLRYQLRFIETRSPGEAFDYLRDGSPIETLEIRSDSVLLRSSRRCAVLAVGEGGEGRRVECPSPKPPLFGEHRAH